MKYSILITVYNKEKYIERCIDFACNQTFKDYEVIVVNDGSTDNSEKIIKRKQKKYHFTYYSKPNGGAADTRNYIISKVKTPYFLFVDADDYLDLDCLETLDKYSDYDYDLLSFNAYFFGNNYEFKKYIKKPVFRGRGDDFFEKIWMLDFVVVPWGLVYKTDFFRREGFKYNAGYLLDDFCVTPFVILTAKKVLSIDYVGYYYFKVPNSLMTKKGNDQLMFKTYEYFYDKLIEQNKKGNYSRMGKIAYQRSLVYTMLWVGENYKGKEQREYMKRLKEKKVYHFFKIDGLIGRFHVLLMDLYLYYPLIKIKKGIKNFFKRKQKFL